MNKLLSIIIAFYLSSCQQPQETTFVPQKPDPWVYINRISDTLPEVEGFSLWNSTEKNLEILKKHKTDKYSFKYRIGQNRFIPVRAVFINSFHSACIILDYYYLYIGLNHSEELIFNWKYFENVETFSTDSIAKIFFNYVSDTENYNSRIFIRFDFFKGLKQESIFKTYDKIAQGYLKFLSIISIKKHNIGFEKLSIKRQNEIIKLFPLFLEYNFYLLLNKPN